MSNYKHTGSKLIVWYDAHAYDDEHAPTRELLKGTLGDIFIMNDKQEWQRLIGRNCISQRLILIISGQFGCEIVPKIHESSNILSIYVYCQDKARNQAWANDYSKVNYILFS